MPQGNGSPPAWCRPPAFPVQGESQLHATGNGAWWQRGSGAVVGTIRQQGAEGMRCIKMEMGEGDRTKQGSKMGLNESEMQEISENECKAKMSFSARELMQAWLMGKEEQNYDENNNVGSRKKLKKQIHSLLVFLHK